MPEPRSSEPKVRLHRKDNVEAWHRAHEIAVPAFRSDPLFAWMFMEHKDDDEREERPQVFLRPVIKSAPICGGYVLDAMDWGSMMIVSEPGQNYDGRLLIQYLKYVDKIKLKVLPKSRIRDCFYVLLTATEASHRKQGFLSALIQYLMEEARRVAQPVWLKATSLYSMNQFLRHGFELVEDIKMGEGKVNSQGKKEAGGDGVLIACMIWWPEKMKDTFANKS